MTSREVSMSSFIAPIIITLLVLAAYLSRDSWLISIIHQFPDAIQAAVMLNRGLKTLLALSFCWLLSRLLNDFFWRRIVPAKTGRPAPQLVINLTTGIILLLAIVLIAVLLLELSVVALVGVGVGVALIALLFFKEFISDVLAGLSVYFDNVLAMGEMISLGDQASGIVRYIGWRSIHLEQADGRITVVPNSIISANLVHRLGSKRSLSFQLTLDFSISVERAVRILNAALQSCISSGMILAKPKPRAYAKDIGEYGNLYAVTCQFDVEKHAEESVSNAVLSQVMTHLDSTGLSVALPRQQVFVGEARSDIMHWESVRDRYVLLGGISLLQTLNDEELQQLAACVLIHQVKAGATVIKEGDLSTSMYGLAEGLLQVRVAREGDQDLVIASMEPGEFFGEMSLLAGEPRSATVVAHVDSVVFEIRQSDFSEILEKRRELVDSISHMIAERQVTNSELLDAATPEEREAAVDEAASSLMGRMLGVFSRMKTK